MNHSRPTFHFQTLTTKIIHIIHIMHINPRKFLGQKSSPCRKCRSVNAYVNSLGGISCQTCYPPRQPEHCLLRIISESGVWTAECEAFFSGSDDLSPGTTSPPQAATRPAGPAEPTTQTDYLSSLHPGLQNGYRRRKSSEPFDGRELTWVIEPGGILDQMAAAAGSRRPAVSRTGETIAEISDRQARFRDRTFQPRRRVPSNAGSIAAVTTGPMRFIRSETVAADGRTVERLYDEFPTGTPVRLFPGQNVPECDPEAVEIRSSITGQGKEGRRLVVVRLPAEIESGGRLRLMREDHVRVV
jgi:hypothetical protein